MKEKWKDVEGYEGLYQISNTGKVKSFHNGEKILKECVSVFGYPQVTLHKNSKRKQISIHRLVAEHFLPTNNKELVVNHKDGNPENNNVNNLEWVTQKENVQHSWDNGFNPDHSENSHFAKLPNVDVVCIKELDGCMTQREISEMFEVSQPTISDILNGKIWNRMPEDVSHKDVSEQKRNIILNKLKAQLKPINKKINKLQSAANSIKSLIKKWS